MLFLKLKLDSAKRQAEKDAAVHAQLLKAHLEEMSTARTQYEAKCTAFQTERAALVMQFESLQHEARALRDAAANNDAAAAAAAASDARVEDPEQRAREATARAEEPARLVDMTHEVERLRHDRATASTAAGTWEEERAHLQAALDAAAAQRGNAFSALETARRELEETAAALVEANQQ